MIFNVASLLTAREGAERRITLEDAEIRAGGHHLRSINGSGRLIRTDRTILVTAVVSATAEDQCSRCLSPAEMRVQASFEEEFEPANRDLVSVRVKAGAGDVDPALVIDEHNMLDLSVALGQSLSSSVPLAPLCSPGCAGLCPGCFVNLNVADCTCDENPIDPRWQSLAELLTGSANSQR